MCIGAPVKVLTVSDDGSSAEVETQTGKRTVSLMLLEQSCLAGDYLLLQVGDFAVDKLTPQQADKALALQQALAEEDYLHAAQLYD